MPTLTLTLTDDEMAQLQARLRENQTPEDWALAQVRRVIRKPKRVKPLVRQLQSSLHRLTRQAILTDYIRQHGPPEGADAKRRLAERLGVSERTLYQDTTIALAVLAHEGTPEIPIASTLPAPQPRPPIGRPRKIPRYKKATT